MTSSTSNPPSRPAERGNFLETGNYRGVRDFFPPDQRMRSWLFGRMREVLASFGYEEYEGPLVEPIELYARKSSEEIVREQLYSFKDRGDRVIAIRPEMTPTLARMVASSAQKLPKPIRWYSIPTCMRYERPQRGRFREFDQLNVDLLGGVPLDEDIEIILTAIALMERLGAKAGDFQVKVNHRGVVNDFLFGALGIPLERKAEIFRLMDKRDKITEAEFKDGGETIGLGASELASLDRFLGASLGEIAEMMPDRLGAVRELESRLDALERLVPGYVVFDPTVMRGFDYYTALVFEIFDTNPENRRALFGGGRYDDLVSAFGVAPLPGIGYGVSDVSLLNFMSTHKLLPALEKEVDVTVLRFSDADRLSALELASELRKLGLRVEAPLTAAKFGKQIQAAERSGAKAVAFRGEEELQGDFVAFKWLETGLQERVPRAELHRIAEKLR